MKNPFARRPRTYAVTIHHADGRADTAVAVPARWCFLARWYAGELMAGTGAKIGPASRVKV